MYLNDKRVLVAGGAGFIGSHIVEKLLSQDCSVTILDDLSTGHISNIPSHAGVTFVEGSVLDSELVSELSSKCDLILNLASYTGMRLVSEFPQKSFDITCQGTRNVLDGNHSVPVVLFSSSAVYGFSGKNQEARWDYNELRQSALDYDGDIPGYACGKVEMERIGLEASGKGRQVIIVRPFNIVGYGQSSGYGMVVPSFIENALGNKPLTIYNNGNQVRCFSCIDVFVDSLERLISKEDAWRCSEGIFNIGSERTTSINELAEYIITTTGSRSIIEYESYYNVFRKKDVQTRVAVTEKLKKYIGNTDWPDMETIVDNILGQTHERARVDVHAREAHQR